MTRLTHGRGNESGRGPIDAREFITDAPVNIGKLIDVAFIDDQIAAMEERLLELQPALEEADLIRRSIANLRKEQAKAKAAPPKGNSTAKGTDSGSFHFFFVPGYTGLEERKKQVAQILEEDPNMTNQAVGDVLGVSAARVSQIRKALAAE